MSIVATTSSTTRELIPAGNYIARAYQMIEIGTVTEFFNGESKQMKKVRIGWELPTELKIFKEENGEQPLVISKEYTLSMHEKSKLRIDLKSWRGKDFTEEEARSFDITKLLGAPCMLNIIHKPSKDGTRMYQEIAGITSLPKGMKAPPQLNKNFVLSYDNFDEDVFEKLPDFIKQKMKGSVEYARIQQPNVTHMNGHDIDFNRATDFEDEQLPF